jgi:hypothetical protein
MTSSIGPIIVHSQRLDAINALEEYFESNCIKCIRSDGKNLYIDFKPLSKDKLKLKLMHFVSSEFVLSYKGETFPFTHQFYDL